MEHRNNVNASLLTQLEKFNNKTNEKSQKYQSMDPEYVTWQMIVVFWSFF